MQTLELIKDLKRVETTKKGYSQKQKEINYQIIINSVFDNKDIKFNGSTINTKAKNKLAGIFMQGGYLSKDGQEASKPAQSKINRYAIIFASKKIQTLVKNAKSPSDVSKIFIDNKLTSQGKLLTFAGQKPKTALEILKNGFRKLSDNDQDEAQEYVIWINSEAKREGYLATQQEIDAIDNQNQQKAV